MPDKSLLYYGMAHVVHLELVLNVASWILKSMLKEIISSEIVNYPDLSGNIQHGHIRCIYIICPGVQQSSWFQRESKTAYQQTH